MLFAGPRISPATVICRVATARPSRAILTAGTWALAVAASLLTWAWSDVLTWQRIFESRGLYEYDAAYQSGHQAVLFGLIALGALLFLRSGLLWAAGLALAVYTLAYGGVADLLYYWLDGRALPSTLPWLDSDHPLILVHPVSNTGLITSGTAWVALWLTLLAVAMWSFGRRRPTDRVSRSLLDRGAGV